MDGQLLEAAAGADEVLEPDELELSPEPAEPAAGAELSEEPELSDLEESLPDLASELPFADAGFGEE